MHTIPHAGGTHERTAQTLQNQQESLRSLLGLIEESEALHLRLQILAEELHGHSELSRACRGILQDLYRLGPRTVPQLARGRPVSRQDVRLLVNRLITEGLAESLRNPEHKRSYLVRLTPPGTTLLEEMWSRELAVLDSLHLDISHQDLQAATSVLSHLREALEQYQLDQG